MAERSLREIGEDIEAMLHTCVWNGDPIANVLLHLEPNFMIDQHLVQFGLGNPNGAVLVVIPTRLSYVMSTVQRRTTRRKNSMWVIEGYWDVGETREIREDWYDQLDYISDVINSEDYNQLNAGVAGAGTEMSQWVCSPYRKRVPVSDSHMLRADWAPEAPGFYNAQTLNANPNS